ncbi:protein Jade-3 isoform X1 [Echinops telfairi]|uniref:Protein Jade-3 isoform X1 n=1 Tax=Echinops telfairi TaxID=9371 RepID=A0ABM0J2B7_ECHTE|nr:protein Jade-3 isoform X1 [Echinops telfairi]
MKRNRHPSSSDSSDENPSIPLLRIPSEHKRPAEVFRKDLISAMKVSDSHYLDPDSYYIFSDTWKEEWEKGVQVPANPDSLPEPSIRIIGPHERVEDTCFIRPWKYIHSVCPEPSEPGFVSVLEMATAVCRYDLDDMDIYWLRDVNSILRGMGYVTIDETLMEKAMEALECLCHEKMNHAINTQEGLGIEYDADVICDVCRSPDSEEGNDMVFCDRCNICVHQACYGILKIPEGSWLCRPCVLGTSPQCMFCPNQGGAMKANRTGNKWAHVSCSLWIPEVRIASPERMEPITKISHVPPSRWALVCSLCKLKMGACIQCSVKSCITAFHVTCAFEQNLEMRTILDEGDEVRFKSYCVRHSYTKRAALGEPDYAVFKAAESQVSTEKVNLRALKLQELEEDFYTLVHAKDVAAELDIPKVPMNFIYNYWILKRKSNFNKPLFPPIEEESLPKPIGENIQTRMRRFMHLRQDLERVRNLCYMISRREKLKMSHVKMQEQIFNLEIQLVNQELASGPSVTSAPENSIFSPPPRITLKLKMPKPSLDNCKNGSTEPEHRRPSPGSSSPAVSMKNKPTPQKGPEMRMKSSSRYPFKNKNTCMLASLSHPQSEVKDSSPAWKTPSPDCCHGQSLGKPLVLPTALHGQSSIENKKIPPSARLAKSNGLEGSLSGEVTPKDSLSEMVCGQEPMLSSHLPSQGSYRKPTVEHLSTSFKEATSRWVRSTEDLQSYVKPTKINPKEQLWGKQLLRRSSGKASYQENDGYCPDLELSDSEAESDGTREKVKLRRDNSDRENPPRDSKRYCHGKNKTHSFSHSSVQR